MGGRLRVWVRLNAANDNANLQRCHYHITSVYLLFDFSIFLRCDADMYVNDMHHFFNASFSMHMQQMFITCGVN
jgi:hypothetical protein